MGAVFVGIDLGGSSIKTVRADADGRVESVRRIRTCTHNGASGVLDQLSQLIDAYVANAKDGGELGGIGIGTPGLVDEEGYLRGQAVNIDGWDQISITGTLRERFAVPIRVQNDTTLATLAELRRGAGRNVRNLIAFFLGTGLGGGIVADGRLYFGHHGLAGEFGHTVVEPTGPACKCGQAGCLEQYASAQGVVRLCAELAPRYDSPLAEVARRARTELTAELVYRYVQAGDPLASAVHDVVCEMLARGVGVLMNALAPERVVLGGGVLRSGSFIPDSVRGRIHRYTLPAVREDCRIVEAGLGADAGAIGAVLLALGEDSPAPGVVR
jgi:glucokinase